jgi:hypothetical protein
LTLYALSIGIKITRRTCLSTHRRSRSCAPQPHHPQKSKKDTSSLKPGGQGCRWFEREEREEKKKQKPEGGEGKRKIGKGRGEREQHARGDRPRADEPRGKEKTRIAEFRGKERQPASTRSIHVAPTHIITPLLCQSRRGHRDWTRSWLIGPWTAVIFGLF